MICNANAVIYNASAESEQLRTLQWLSGRPGPTKQRVAQKSLHRVRVRYHRRVSVVAAIEFPTSRRSSFRCGRLIFDIENRVYIFPRPVILRVLEDEGLVGKRSFVAVIRLRPPGTRLCRYQLWHSRRALMKEEAGMRSTTVIFAVNAIP